MALPKSVKQGSAYFKGFSLSVGATPGSYILDMALSRNAVVNAITIIPDQYGPGDTYKLEHLTSNTSSVLSVLGENLYNMGKNVSNVFEFPALEPMGANEPLRLTYNNIAGTSMNVRTIVEYVGYST